jgi:hypothetical protein
MSASERKISEAVRGRKAIERPIVRELSEARRAGSGAASQGLNATLTSGAMVAHVASGLLAGIALAQKQPRRGR